MIKMNIYRVAEANAQRYRGGLHKSRGIGGGSMEHIRASWHEAGHYEYS